MFEEFDAQSQTKVLRDADRVTRALSHPRYVATDARTPPMAAAFLDALLNYLERI
jgi:hypothetical protein